MIPNCLERKVAEVQAICSEHGLYFAFVVLDEEGDDEEADFQCVFRGDDAFGLWAAAALLRLLQEEDTELTKTMDELRIEEYESFEEEAVDNEELPRSPEDIL